jgi:hypothetical protein
MDVAVNCPWQYIQATSVNFALAGQIGVNGDNSLAADGYIGDNRLAGSD